MILTPNLKWNANTKFICKKAFKSLWSIRRMRKLGLDTFSLVDYYIKEVRVHLELAVPVWHSGLTKKLTADIERVQRIAIGVILDKTVIHYAQDCAMIGLKPLNIRRVELCERFATKTATKGRHTDMFQILNNGAHYTRGNADEYREHICRTSRFFKSPLPYLTRVLNQ